MVRFREWLVVLCAALIAVPALSAQGGTEIVRGHVSSTDLHPIAYASITITGLVTRTVLTASTNTKGDYTALSTAADGDYIVQVRAIGYVPVTLRLRRSGLASVLVADAVLRPMAVHLDTITVTANRGLSRGADRPSIGGIAQNVLSGALFSLDPSDLMALATLTPGVLATAGDSTTYSVLGAAANQNSIIVDGMKFSGDNLPRDAIGSATMVTTTYDPSRGQFAGGQISIRTKGGTDVFQAVGRGQSANRLTTWADATSPIAPPRITMASGSISGPIRKGKAHYLIAADLNAGATENFSLLAPSNILLSQFGLSVDTAAAVRAALTRLGVPVTAAGVPADRQDDRQTMFARFDWTPTSTVSLTVNLNGNWRQQGGAGVSQLAYPSISNQSSRDRVSMGVSFSGFTHGFLDEFNGQIRHGTNSGSQYLEMAGASVRVGTQFDSGRTGLTSLRFGGSTSGNRSQVGNSLQFTNELSWLTPDNQHRFKIGQSFDGDWEHELRARNQFGTYTYQSLADLIANRPASYTRTLRPQDLANRGSITGFWAGDEWRASSAWQFQGGARVDIGHQGVLPEYNPVVDSLFGLHTNEVPRQVGLSPRLGFSWASPTRRGAAKDGAAGPSFDGNADRSEAIPTLEPTNAPGITVSGGIGAFRGVVDPEDIAGLIAATGLANTSSYLACAGDATPIPQWTTAQSTIANACADGTGPGVFSVSQPNVRVFDASFRPPVSWRGNVGVEGIRLPGWSLAMTGTYSIGRNGESGIDLNLARTVAFTLGSEANRPVYVAPSSIVSETGVIAPGAARVTQQFGQVTSTLADLKSIATQLTATFTARRPLLGKIPVSLQYVYSHQRAEERGFDGTTAGDPFLKEWASGQQPTHQIIITAAPRVWWFTLGVRMNLLSGTPYTPVVVGDINGDGLSNDRAFIADPSASADPALAGQTLELLAAAPAGAQRCLRAQFGQIATRNSCHTGWQARMDLNLNFTPPDNLGFGNRLRLTMNLLNTTGALVRVFGLDNTAFGRSAMSTIPDARLLYVTGFDPATQRFRYSVNQLFGEPIDFGAARRRFAPFQVQVGFEYKIGGPPKSSLARTLGLVGDKKAAALTAADVRQRLQTLTANPVAPVLAQGDSIGLTSGQVATLNTINAEFRAQVDSALAPLVAYLVDKGTKVQDTELTDRIAKLQPGLKNIVAKATARVAVVLSPEQKSRFPSLLPTGAH